VETHITQNPDGDYTTNWETFRPPANHNVPSTEPYIFEDEGTIATGLSIGNQFYAQLAKDVYTTHTDYFKSPIDVLSVGGEMVCYRYESQFSTIPNMRVYSPILSGATDTVDAPIYILFKGTDSVFNAYRSLDILLDYLNVNPIPIFETEMNTIYSAIKTYLEGLTTPRKVYIIGHSLGAMYGIHLLHSLMIQESPNFDAIELSYELHMFNPLLLADSAVQFFRSNTALSSTKSAVQFAKTNIHTHSIQGDFLSPLLANAGVGHIHRYDQVEAHTSSIDTVDFLLGTWLGQVVGAIDRNSYLDDDNHKIDSFNTDPDPVNNPLHTMDTYKLINPFPTIVNHRVGTKTFKTVKTLQSSLITYIQHHIYLWDKPSNLDGSLSFGNYPGIDSDYRNFNFSLSQHSDSYVLSTVGTDNYINFKLAFTPDAPLSISAGAFYRYLVKITSTEYLLGADAVGGIKYFRITSQGNTQDPMPIDDNTGQEITPNSMTPYFVLPTQFLHMNTNTQTISTMTDYENASVANKERWKFKLYPPAVDGSFHVSNRRTEQLDVYTPPPITYTGLEALFQTPSNGYGYFNIKMIGTTTDNPNYLYMEDGTNLTVYARPAPTSEGLFGISHTDNSTNPDEHVWKVSKVAGSTNLFTVQNTAYPTKYLGSMGSVSGTTPALNTPPQLLIEEDFDVTTTDYYNMSLKGQNSTDYMAYWYVVNSLYHYVDFQGLNNTNYNIDRINFKFEPI